MIFHVLNQSHKRTHAIRADAFNAYQHTSDSPGKASILHTVLEFITRDVEEHWFTADKITEVVVARIKTTKDYTVVAEQAIERPAASPSKQEQQRLTQLMQAQQNLAHTPGSMSSPLLGVVR